MFSLFGDHHLFLANYRPWVAIIHVLVSHLLTLVASISLAILEKSGLKFTNNILFNNFFIKNFVFGLYGGLMHLGA